MVFLDIEMPRGNAFDLLEQWGEIDFEIIFITAFSQYAIQAFNLSAAHYLLKPVDIEELENAVATGENVAAGQTSATAVMNAWLNSSSHKENIEGNFTHIGIAAIQNSNGTYYYTQLFFRK